MYETIRKTLTQHLITQFTAFDPNLVLVFSNDPFDWNNPPPTFVYFDITFEGANQIGMSNTPKAREHGVVATQVCVREGLGSALAGAILQQVKDALGFQIFSPTGARISCDVFRPNGSATVKGWLRLYGRAVFHADPA